MRTVDLLLLPSGRLSRRDFWLRGVVAIVLVGLPINAAIVLVTRLGGYLLTPVLIVPLIWFGMALWCKRLHDRGRSGLWLLLLLLPLVNVVAAVWLMIEAMFLRGDLAENDFGAVPAQTYMPAWSKGLRLVVLIIIWPMSVVGSVILAEGSEASVSVELPVSAPAVTASRLEPAKLTIVLAANGKITCDGQEIGMTDVGPLVRKRIGKSPETAVTIVADRAASPGLVVRLVDLAKSAGAPAVSMRIDASVSREKEDGAALARMVLEKRLKPETVLVYDSGGMPFAGKVCFTRNLHNNVANRELGETYMAATGRIVIVVIRSIESGAHVHANVSAGNAYLMLQTRCIAPIDPDFLEADVDFIHLAEVDLKQSNVEIARSLGFDAVPTPEALREATVAFRLGDQVNRPFFLGGSPMGFARENVLRDSRKPRTPRELQLVGLVVDSGELLAVFQKGDNEQVYCLPGDSFGHAGGSVTVTRIGRTQVTVSHDGKTREFAVERIETVAPGSTRRFRAQQKNAAANAELRLVGVVDEPGHPLAILRRSSGDTVLCGKGESFTDAGQKVTVTAIDGKTVTITRNGQVRKLSGQ